MQFIKTFFRATTTAVILVESENLASAFIPRKS